MLRFRTAAVTRTLAAVGLSEAFDPAPSTRVAAARPAKRKAIWSLAARAARIRGARRVLGREKEFLWSATTLAVGGSAWTAAALFVDRGEPWKPVLVVAPVYVAYQTYRLFIARREDQKRHLDEMTRLERERGVLLEREQAARASADAANRLKDQFLATVSHELRTPVNAILGWADMLRLGMLPADRKDRACEAIFNNAVRQARLIEELLDMSRIMGKLQLERSDVDPREIAQGAIQIAQNAAESKRISIEVDIADNAGRFHVDGRLLQQVLWNLLSNAIKFTPEGGAVRLAIYRAGNLGEIVVSDTGIGIPREFLSAVFEPFRQADGTPTREHDGLGLGLAIVKQMVDAHGGTISVISEGTGHGATFTVRLPVHVQRLTTIEEAVPSTVAPDWTTARNT
jgi:signal transduction histidine kinase